MLDILIRCRALIKNISFCFPPDNFYFQKMFEFYFLERFLNGSFVFIRQCWNVHVITSLHRSSHHSIFVTSSQIHGRIHVPITVGIPIFLVCISNSPSFFTVYAIMHFGEPHSPVRHLDCCNFPSLHPS